MNARPYLLHSINTLYTITNPSSSNSNSVNSTNSVVGLATTLAHTGGALFQAGSQEWHSFNLNMQSANPNASEVPYSWYNTHLESFTQQSITVIATRLLIACLIVGITKLLFKFLPSWLFGALHKHGLTQDGVLHRTDCFGRVVPAAKAYVVEVPVRYVVYLVHFGCLLLLVLNVSLCYVLFT